MSRIPSPIFTTIPFWFVREERNLMSYRIRINGNSPTWRWWCPFHPVLYYPMLCHILCSFLKGQKVKEWHRDVRVEDLGFSSAGQSSICYEIQFVNTGTYPPDRMKTSFWSDLHRLIKSVAPSKISYGYAFKHCSQIVREGCKIFKLLSVNSV